MQIDRTVAHLVAELPETLLRNELIGTAAARLAWATRRMAHTPVRVSMIRFYQWDLPLEDAPAPAEFTAREVSMNELAALAPVFGRTSGELHRRARLGDRCFCSFHEGRPIHMRWIATRPVELPELGMYVCPAQEEFYAYDSVTIPAYRGKRAASAARRESEHVMRGAGYRRGFAFVGADNEGSLRTLNPSHKLLYEVASIRLLNGQAHLAGKTGHPLYFADRIPAIDQTSEY